MPNTNKGGGISRKIFDVNLRKKLKEIVTSLKINEGMGVIIRTAGQNMKKNDISRDYKALIKLWTQITAKTIKSTAPSLIHEEGNLLKRSVRDYFTSDISEIIINNKDTFKNAKEIMKFFMPGFTKHISLDDNKRNSLFSSYKMEKQINEMHKPIVNLKSGGYLVINQTEALVAIDINSGRSTKQRNIEDTALKTNLEAAEEIAMQLQLRDLAGLIVIDFIDMLERSNNFKVERKMKESIKDDRARIQCGRISSFGLMEISRQRLKQIINSAVSHKCDHCNGSGSINNLDFSAMQILRVCEEILISDNQKNMQIIVNPEMYDFISNHKNDFFQSLNTKYKIKIILIQFEEFTTSDSIICSNNEVIYKNCENEYKISNAIQSIDNKKSFENHRKALKSSQKDNFSKKSSYVKKDNFSKKSYERDSLKNRNNEENIKKENIIPIKILKEKSKHDNKHNISHEIKSKRTSYRTKAEDLINDKKKVVKKNTHQSKRKKMSNELEKITAIKNKEKVIPASSSKKEGWWNQ